MEQKRRYTPPACEIADLALEGMIAASADPEGNWYSGEDTW